MHVAIIGSHGIPARYGGFETFAEHLAIALSESGYQLTVVNERDHKDVFPHDGVRILHSEFNKSVSPLSYYRDSIKLVRDADVVIVCGSGGSLYYKRFINAKIITNIDGLEHLRRRYSFIQRKVVYLLQKFAIKNSDVVITDSDEVLKYWKLKLPKFANKMRMIAYGADEFLPTRKDILNKYGLQHNEYFLVIARLVPENNIRSILNAFRHYKSNKKLVIVGNVDSRYAERLKRLADKRVVLTGGIYDKGILDSLREGCYLYIHGHSVGGTNPSLLEAMAARCACICHDNVFNRETTAGMQEYFRESFELAIHLNSLEHNPAHVDELKTRAFNRVSFYSWEKMAAAYLSLIRETVKGNL